MTAQAQQLTFVEPQFVRRYLTTLCLVFVLASALILFPAIGVALLTGSILLPEEMGTAQNSDPNIVALPFDLRYWAALKIPRIAKEQPEIVSIGSSRGMEVRSQMFAPYKFYNASLTAWTLDQEITMVDRITRVSRPRVIIVGIDYFMFTNAYSDAMTRERTMVFGNGLSFRRQSFANLMRELWNDPPRARQLFEDWRFGRFPIKFESATLLGIDAIRNVAGFRFDGSMMASRGAYAQASKQIAENKGLIDAAPGGPSIDMRQYDALERLAAIGRERGVTIVAVQFPIFKSSVDFLDNDPHYHYYAGIWREFESPSMRKKMQDIGITFFDMSRDPMTGQSELFMDAAHPTEMGMSVAITHLLLEDARFRTLFPEMSAERLRAERETAIEKGNRFEVYGN